MMGMNPESSSPHVVDRGPTERVSTFLQAKAAACRQKQKYHEEMARERETGTDKEWEAGRKLAERMSGNKIPRTSTKERLRLAVCDRRIALKCANEAALFDTIQAERETLITALRVARKAVYAMAEGSHLLDGFGPRKRTPLDDDLDQVEAALASVGKGVNG